MMRTQAKSSSLNNIAQQHSLKPTVISNSAFGKYNKHNWVQTREWYRAMNNFNTTPRCLSDMKIVQVHQVDWFTAPIGSRFTGVNGKKRADIICYLADAEGVWLSVDIFSWCEATQLWTGQNSRTFEPCPPQVRECCRFAKTLWLLVLSNVCTLPLAWFDWISGLSMLRVSRPESTRLVRHWMNNILRTNVEHRIATRRHWIARLKNGRLRELSNGLSNLLFFFIFSSTWTVGSFVILRTERDLATRSLRGRNNLCYRIN